MSKINNDPAKNDLLILVDVLDRELGAMTKEQTHKQAILHRAFSVVLYRNNNARTELLICQRSNEKYHCGGMWANSCCSHPRCGEKTCDAVLRRVKEELGVEISQLEEIGTFIYRAQFECALCEYELDHVFIACCATELNIDYSEVQDYKWLSISEINDMLICNAECFAPWAYSVLLYAIKKLS